MKKLFLALSLLALAACATTIGKKFDPAAINNLQPGITTVAEAEAQLGVASNRHYAPNGSTILGWSYTTGAPFTKPHSEAVMIHFDKDQKMVRIVSRQSM